ncbi:calcium/sodium antiporter [Algicella marina]|uniref:calcium/sodium antiporter n=1 Tax=Algicella marina TaxID=2683284 RepID=UPI0024DFB44A|nr:calcium/sodium antiporter [Algicella marina]
MHLILISIAGLVLLIVAGDLLVRGAVSLSLKLGIPALIVSLTVVAFGTSAPELLIAIQSALEGAPGLAFGNVIGSNIANILLVLGLPAVISGLHTAECDTRHSYVQMLAASVVFIVICFLGPLYVLHGLILLSMLGYMLFSAARAAGRSRACDAGLEEGDAHMAGWKITVFILAGIVGLPLGAHFLIEGATGLASKLGVSDAVIGLTLVAVGTSLPELATTVVAAIRRNADVALGNVIGSNMFNILGIMGVASFFGPLPLDRDLLYYDLWVMLAAALAILPFVFRRRDITRAIGVGFLLVYAVYLVTLF